MPDGAFWDTSALVPLFVQQRFSADAHTYEQRYSPVVWWATAVEIHSSIQRLHHQGKIQTEDRSIALRSYSLMRLTWREVRPNQQVRTRAQALLAKHSLRAADSLQLAAALHWYHYRPHPWVFLSADQRLCEAAGVETFQVIALH